MTPDLQSEFQSLLEAAMRQLKDVLEVKGHRPVFSLWVTPSFTPAFRCTVYAPLPFAKGAQPFASFTIWRSDLDHDRLRTPVERLRHPKDLYPTIEDDTLGLTDSDVEGFQQRMRGISVPLYLGPAKFAGCDGTNFEFCCDEIFYGASLHWWECEPVEWRPFTAVVVQIVSELEARRKGKDQHRPHPTAGGASASDLAVRSVDEPARSAE